MRGLDNINDFEQDKEDSHLPPRQLSAADRGNWAAKNAVPEDKDDAETDARRILRHELVEADRKRSRDVRIGVDVDGDYKPMNAAQGRGCTGIVGPLAHAGGVNGVCLVEVRLSLALIFMYYV